ncbi:hypothetical protein BDV93DRAFT_509584 [Ceratobasidium sp. AG-I]|nr:hypothetical protein BDV93DRAFT_509584 [Ceratobasidium sp. AG-I]
MVKSLINSMKVAGYRNEQCELLKDFTGTLSQLQGVKARFETKLKRKSRILGNTSSIRQAIRLGREDGSPWTFKTCLPASLVICSNQTTPDWVWCVALRWEVAVDKNVFRKLWRTIRARDMVLGGFW